MPQYNESKFLFSVALPKDLPSPFHHEVVFFGSSNVGKSSLINALCSRRNLARVSKTPGRTQLLNFFSVPPDLTLVDAPGYGFATASLQIRSQWERLIIAYLDSRATLAKACVLVDARRNLRCEDTEVLHLLQRKRISSVIVFTKVDKLKKQEQHFLTQNLKNIDFPFILTSSKDGTGIVDLRHFFKKIIKQIK